MGTYDWKALVIAHARQSGAQQLPLRAVHELAAHLEDIYLEALADGRPEAEALAAARTALQEAPLSPIPAPHGGTPDARPWSAGPPEESQRLTGLVGDVRFAWRQLRRAPSFAAVAILTLGLGAGAATAIFSVVNAVLLRPLPYREPAQLVSLWEHNAEKGLPKERLSPVNFMDYRGVRAVFTDAAAWWRPEINLSEPGTEPIRVNAIETSANLFQLLGVSTELGPGFPTGGPFNSRDLIAVISDRLWRQRYHADPGVVGRLLHVNAGDYRVVGVMPRGFTFPDEVDLWLRLNWDLTRHSRNAHFMEAVARLKPDATIERAAGELDRLSARLARENVATNRGWSVRPRPLLDDMLGYYRPALLVLLGAVGLLLVTSCLNVASLLLARASTRSREIAVRAALGASRGRLLRQMLMESMVLALAGTAAGAAGALVLLRLAISWMPVNVPRLHEAGVDLRLLAFTVGVVIATSIVFGLLPALVLSRTHASDALKDGTRTAGSLRTRRWNRTLVVAEIAVAAAVLLSSALLVRSVSRMIHAPTGVIASGVVTANLQLTGAAYETWEDVQQFYGTLLDGIRRQPGIDAAGATTHLPLTAGWRMPFSVEGRDPGRVDERPIAQLVSVTAGYFEAFRVPLLGGRLFNEFDATRSEPVVVVNQMFAKRFFPGEEAIGHRLASTAGNIGPLGRNLAGQGPFRIVGVVADVHQAPLSQADEPVIYHAQRQFPFRAMALAARGRDTAAVTAAIRTALAQVDPAIPLSGVRTMEEQILSSAAAPRLLMFVLTAFAGITALLAAIGVYGLLACVVSDRRREIAIRLALGARPAVLATVVTTQGLKLAVAGAVTGLACAQLAGGWFEDLLFRTRTTDPAAILWTTALLLGATVVACAGPAIRAARVPPVDGLKGE
jgi:predicted permease